MGVPQKLNWWQGAQKALSEMTGRWVNLESLAGGLYFIEGFRNGQSVGFTKIIKE